MYDIYTLKKKGGGGALHLESKIMMQLVYSTFC